MLADDELLNRENGRVARLRKNANLKYHAARLSAAVRRYKSAPYTERAADFTLKNVPVLVSFKK